MPRRRLTAALAVLLLAAVPLPAIAAEAVDPRTLSLWWVLPFVGVLLSIAIFPLVSPHWWHRFYGPVMLGWALAFLIPATLSLGLPPVIDLVLHTGREDPDHPGHSPNRGSVMYWAVERDLVGTLLGAGPATTFDDADRAELAAIRRSSDPQR